LLCAYPRLFPPAGLLRRAPPTGSPTGSPTIATSLILKDLTPGNAADGSQVFSKEAVMKSVLSSGLTGFVDYVSTFGENITMQDMSKGIQISDIGKTDFVAIISGVMEQNSSLMCKIMRNELCSNDWQFIRQTFGFGQSEQCNVKIKTESHDDDLPFTQVPGTQAKTREPALAARASAVAEQ
jgi:hypothetical protein